MKISGVSSVTPQPVTPRSAPASQQGPVDQVSLGHDDNAEILQAARLSPLRSEPALGTVEQRWYHVPGEVRDAAGLHLMDLVTEPDAGRSRRGLVELAEGMTWAQRFKSQARQAAVEGGMPAVIQKAQAEHKEAAASTPVEQLLQSGSLLKQSRLGQTHVQEANRLLEQFKAGNDNPGIGTKTLGKGVSYLRGREGTRIFYRMQDGNPQFLAVVTKPDEPAAISLLRDRFDLR